MSILESLFIKQSTGKVKSIKELGDQEKLSASHVSRVILVGFLSPDIVRDILDGKHPPSLTSDKLMRASCIDRHAVQRLQRRHSK